MQRDFEIIDGIILSQPPYKLDLHNNYLFYDLHYSVEQRTLSLRWRRRVGEFVPSGTPAAISVTFQAVSEFRFYPRDAKIPFSEDDCVNTFGFWTDEAWAAGVIIINPTQTAHPSWLTAIDFMSSAVIVVGAASAHAQVEA